MHAKYRTVAWPVEMIDHSTKMLVVLFMWSGWNWQQIAHRYDELK